MAPDGGHDDRRLTTPRIPPVEKVVAKARADAPEGRPLRPFHLAATLAHHRAGRAAVEQAAAAFGDGLDPRLRELVILRMGWDTRSQYEFGQHTLAGRAAGLSDDEIRLVTRPLAEGAWTPTETLVLRMVDDIHADDMVSDEVYAGLATRFDDEHAIGFIGLAATYRFVCIILNSLGIQPEPELPRWPS